MCHVELVPKAYIGTFVMLVKMFSKFVGLSTGTSAERAAGYKLNMCLYLQSVDGFVSSVYVSSPDAVFHSSTYFSM